MTIEIIIIIIIIDIIKINVFLDYSLSHSPLIHSYSLNDCYCFVFPNHYVVFCLMLFDCSRLFQMMTVECVCVCLVHVYMDLPDGYQNRNFQFLCVNRLLPNECIFVSPPSTKKKGCDDFIQSRKTFSFSF